MIIKEQSALEYVSRTDDIDALRKLMSNARKPESRSEAVEKAAFQRLVTLSTNDCDDPVERDCWAMVHAVEELRHQTHGVRKPMNRLRPKIAKDGVVASLEYLALHESDGFREVLNYGFPDLTAEAIVLRHSDRFTPRAVEAAKMRLTSAGIAADGPKQLK